jgi:hypothetical protein
LEFILPLLIAKVHAGKSSAMPVCKRMNLPPTFRNAGLPQEDAERKTVCGTILYIQHRHSIPHRLYTTGSPLKLREQKELHSFVSSGTGN